MVLSHDSPVPENQKITPSQAIHTLKRYVNGEFKQQPPDWEKVIILSLEALQCLQIARADAPSVIQLLLPHEKPEPKKER